MATGRRTSQALAVDATPGKVLALALLANAPIFVGFVLALLLSGPDAARAFAPYVLFGTPLVALWSIVLWARAPAERKAHRAARIGLLLDGVALFLWVMLLIPYLMDLGRG
jgi:hypothetical protein